MGRDTSKKCIWVFFVCVCVCRFVLQSSFFFGFFYVLFVHHTNEEVALARL